MGSSNVGSTRKGVNTLGIPDGSVIEGRQREGRRLPVLTAHDRGPVTKVAEHILHGALA